VRTSVTLYVSKLVQTFFLENIESRKHDNKVSQIRFVCFKCETLRAKIHLSANKYRVLPFFFSLFLFFFLITCGRELLFIQIS
jgi:hypothetical protein